MSELTDQIKSAITKGIGYLALKQQKNGSFLSLSSANPKNFNQTINYNSVFSTSLILGCLNNLEEDNKIRLIKQKCTSFLLNQKSPSWSFNYWVRGSKEAKKMPYPDDLDDTFCALSALYKHNPALFDGQVIAQIVTLLTGLETQEGGPYRTWLIDDKAPKIWQDVDLAVNSNIAYFLKLQGISLPNLNKFIASKVNQAKITSPYYPNPYPIIYFISRSIKQKYKAILKKMLYKEQKNDVWENPLYTALNISSLTHLGISLKNIIPAITYLLSQQSSKGYWKAFAFCLDPALKEQTHYSGSEVLTTAFCLEAIQRYLVVEQQSNVRGIENIHLQSDTSENIYRQIIRNINKRLSGLDSSLKTQAFDCLETTLQKDNKKQVALLPYYFKLSLGNRGKNITDQFLVVLGMANLYGWIAYTIYDNFLDNEGDPKKLSVANFALRELTKIFSTILPGTEFDQFFDKIMDRLENANTWEVTNCRSKNFTIPDYDDLEKLVDRSLGHALAPIAILFYLGFNDRSKEVKSLLHFFKHYLAARQINDDAHDWEKDLRMGHINSVGALLLKRHSIKKATSLSAAVPKLQRLFWYKVIVQVSHMILIHTKMARKSLKQCSIVSNQTLADLMLANIEEGAKAALKERADAIKFLKSYRSSQTDL